MLSIHTAYCGQSNQDALLATDFIRADLPNENTEAQLYALVKKHQIHDCSPEYCGGPMPDRGPCCKEFLAPLEDITHVVPGELRYWYGRKTEANRFVVLYNLRLLLVESTPQCAVLHNRRIGQLCLKMCY